MLRYEVPLQLICHFLYSDFSQDYLQLGEGRAREHRGGNSTWRSYSTPTPSTGTMNISLPLLSEPSCQHEHFIQTYFQMRVLRYQQTRMHLSYISLSLCLLKRLSNDDVIWPQMRQKIYCDSVNYSSLNHDQIPDIINLREKRFILVPGFLWIPFGSVDWGAVVGQNAMAEKRSSPHGK